MRVLAIDFETANRNMESACSIGYCLWNEGEIVKNEEILIKPHPQFGYFERGNISIHGITPQQVEFAYDWPMVFWDIKNLFRDSVAVMHNAPFDIGVLKAINRLYSINMEDFPYLDTVMISRIIHPELPNHKLNTVCDYLGLDFNHHHAGSDALGCIAIVEDAMNIYGSYDIEELLRIMHINCKYYSR